jgi:hypothetical protein
LSEGPCDAKGVYAGAEGAAEKGRELKGRQMKRGSSEETKQYKIVQAEGLQ